MRGPFRAVDMILHAGDVLYHGPRNPLPPGHDPGDLAGRINGSPVPVVIALGNCDAPIDQALVEYPFQNPFAFVQIEGHRFIVHHGDGVSLDDLAALAKRYKAGVAVFGHSHIPHLEEREGVVLVNPGSPALSKAPGGERTVGIIDELRISLISLDANTIISSLSFAGCGGNHKW